MSSNGIVRFNRCTYNDENVKIRGEYVKLDRLTQMDYSLHIC